MGLLEAVKTDTPQEKMICMSLSSFSACLWAPLPGESQVCCPALQLCGEVDSSGGSSSDTFGLAFLPDD